MRRPGMSLLIGVVMAALLGEAGAVTCAAPNATLPLCADEACVGSCATDTGCLCGQFGDYNTCLPDATVTCDMALFENPPPGCCPQGLFWYQTSACCSEELNCEPPCNADEVCTYANGFSVCLCNKTYYQHLNLSDITPTVTCLPQPGQSYQAAHMSISKCQLETLHYDYTQLHFLNSSDTCTGLGYEVTVDGVIQLEIYALTMTGWCGNIMTVTSDTVTFSNFLYIPADTSSGIVYTNPLNFSYSCSYNLTMQTGLSTVLKPVLTLVILPLGPGAGSFSVTMAAYLSNSYTDPLTADTTLPVGTPLYIGIMTDFGDGDTFALRAVRCVASPVNSATDPNAVALIDGGCAVSQETNTQVLSNGQSLEVKFSVNTFTFQNQPDVYLFCEVRLCIKANEVCSACSVSGSR